MEFAEDLIDSNRHIGGTISMQIPDLPNILHDTWKFHKDGNQMGAPIGFMTEKSQMEKLNCHLWGCGQ